MEKKYTVIWNAYEGISWFIRGIRSDGQYYGEIRYDSSTPSRRYAALVEGSIPPGDWARCQDLISQIETLGAISTYPTNDAVLSWWTDSIGAPHIVAAFRRGDQATAHAEALFFVLKDIIEVTLSKDYIRITQPPAAPYLAHTARSPQG